MYYWIKIHSEVKGIAAPRKPEQSEFSTKSSSPQFSPPQVTTQFFANNVSNFSTPLPIDLPILSCVHHLIHRFLALI